MVRRSLPGDVTVHPVAFIMTVTAPMPTSAKMTARKITSHLGILLS